MGTILPARVPIDPPSAAIDPDTPRALLILSTAKERGGALSEDGHGRYMVLRPCSAEAREASQGVATMSESGKGHKRDPDGKRHGGQRQTADTPIW